MCRLVIDGQVRQIAYTGGETDLSQETPPPATEPSKKARPTQQPTQTRPPIIGMVRNTTKGRTKFRCY